MKVPVNIIKKLLIVFMVLVIFSISQAQSEECPSALVNGVPCIGTVKPEPVSEYQPLENKISELLLLARQDTVISWSARKIDMGSRKKFFSDEGWEQYQNYVTWHKKKLVDMEVGKKRLYHVSARIIEGTQKFINSSNELKKFSTEGYFYYGYGDFDDRNPAHFKIDVSFSNADIKNVSKILIQKWNVILIKDKE